MSRPHVVVIGSGFGGIRATKRLTKVDVDITLIDVNNFHTFQPLLYQVATAGLDADDIGFPIRRIFRRNPSVSFVLGEVTGIDLEGQSVTIHDGRTIGFDFLVIAAGTISTSFGIDGVDGNSFPLKTLDDALRLRAHLLTQFERASAVGDPPVDLGIVVVGGGPTGVEMAGGLRELIDRVFVKDYPALASLQIPITLVEAADRVLGPFQPALSKQAVAILRSRNITVELGVGVDHVERDAVVLRDGRRFSAGTIIWAVGVTANPVAGLLGVPLGRGNRIPVNDDLSLPGHPNVFAIGDIALPPGAALPQVAQPAIQEGDHAARQIAARLTGRPTSPFRYHDRGSMATIGRNQAVVEFPNGLRFHGFIGWLMWLGLHLIELMGFRNRANVFVNWAWNYLTYDRASRLLLDPPSTRVEPPGATNNSSR
ncbi:MAG TPA: NAD(P)/FAD-dependent oxidoreductase [Ilumatobacteraceae bacterium]|nr:NAD(P)/FAD-dependent oxidoreductase [Ilumatobacteraceae bacterium]